MADFVISVGGDGRILSQGTISDALKSSKTLLEEFRQDQDKVKKSDAEIDAEPMGAKSSANVVADGKLIVAEEVEEGHVGWGTCKWSVACNLDQFLNAQYTTVKLFFNALGGNNPLLFFVAYVGALVLVSSTLATQTWFLGYWASQYKTEPPIEVPVFLSVVHYLPTSNLCAEFYRRFTATLAFIVGAIHPDTVAE